MIQKNDYLAPLPDEMARQWPKNRLVNIVCHRPDVLTIDYALNDRSAGLPAAEAAWRSIFRTSTTPPRRDTVLWPRRSPNILWRDKRIDF